MNFFDLIIYSFSGLKTDGGELAGDRNGFEGGCEKKGAELEFQIFNFL